MNNINVHKFHIPKRFMQTWKTKDIPDRWKSSPYSIKKMMPSWKYILLTDDDNIKFVTKFFPDFLETFKSFEFPIQRADAIRYMWLYIYGGIYMDLDFEVNKDIEEYLNITRFQRFPQTGIYLVQYFKNDDKIITNSFMISKQKHPFWLDVIEEMKKPISFYNKLIRFTYVYETTGPSMLTRVYQNTKNKYNDIYLIDEIFACTKGLYYIEPDALDYSIIKSIEQTSGESWHSPTETFIVLYLKYKVIFIVLGFILVYYFLIKLVSFVIISKCYL